MSPAIPSLTASVYWPFVILGACVVFVVLAIGRWKIHPFIALTLAGFGAGFLAGGFSPATLGRLPAALRADASLNSWIAAVELTAVEFGSAAGSIGISIGLAAVIGLCLSDSGAADAVVRRFVALLGQRRAALALLAGTYVLSIPIFFDTMFMLMVPLARALWRQTGRDYALYVMVVCAGAILTHCLTVPHPGPLAMVDTLRVDAGQSLLWGLMAGVLPALVGYFFAVAINARVQVAPAGDDARGEPAGTGLPGFWPSLAPVLVPIGLIGAGSAAKVALAHPDATGAAPLAALVFLGNKNVALAVGAGLGLALLARVKGIRFSETGRLLDGPLGTAATIVLITAAGGAFGAMLRHAGVGEAVKHLAQSYDVPLLLVAWLTAFGLRVAQGSATVAMIAAAAIMWPMMDPAANAPLPFHPMYVFLAIGFGASGGSWMNDSGFWVVSKLGGLTERQTLRTWSVLLAALAVIGLLLTLAAAHLLPLRPPAAGAQPLPS